LHRIAQDDKDTAMHRIQMNRVASRALQAMEVDDVPIGEPVLTSDELRALLQDQPMIPPYNAAD
jgi:hypothetical protein